MKQYNGLRAEKIDFTENSIITTSGSCRSIVAFSQAPVGSQGWEQCQEAINAGGTDIGFGEYWVGNMGPNNPDV